MYTNETRVLHQGNMAQTGPNPTPPEDASARVLERLEGEVAADLIGSEGRGWMQRRRTPAASISTLEAICRKVLD